MSQYLASIKYFYPIRVVTIFFGQAGPQAGPRSASSYVHNRTTRRASPRCSFYRSVAYRRWSVQERQHHTCVKPLSFNTSPFNTLHRLYEKGTTGQSEKNTRNRSEVVSLGSTRTDIWYCYSSVLEVFRLKRASFRASHRGRRQLDRSNKPGIKGTSVRARSKRGVHLGALLRERWEIII